MQSNHITIALIAAICIAMPSNTKTWMAEYGHLIERRREEERQTRKRRRQNLLISQILNNTKTGKQEAILLLTAKKHTVPANIIKAYSNYQIANKAAQTLPTYNKINHTIAKTFANRIINNTFTLDQLRTTYTINEDLLQNSKKESSGIIATMLVETYNNCLDRKSNTYIKNLKTQINIKLSDISKNAPYFGEFFENAYNNTTQLYYVEPHGHWLNSVSTTDHRLYKLSKRQVRRRRGKAKTLYAKYEDVKYQQGLCIQDIKNLVKQNKVKLDDNKRVIGLKTDAQINSELGKFLV